MQPKRSKFADFTRTTKECVCETPDLDTYQSLLEVAYARRQQSVRLLGAGVRFVNIDSAPAAMLDVTIPATDGREVRMRRYTKPEKVHQLLLDHLGFTLPAQPPPEIRNPMAVVETF
jgi:hypothetical protein